jgi:uncharacterized membrane protein (UPF0127 family)
MDTDKIISKRIEYANTAVKQIIGLMFRLHIPSDLVIVYDMKTPQPIFIHTFFCFYNIDAVFLNEDHEVVQVMENLQPWQFTFKPSRPARYFIESLTGLVQRQHIRTGDRIKI